MTGTAPVGIRVAGWGAAPADDVVTNAHLETRLDSGGFSAGTAGGSAVVRWDSPALVTARQDAAP